MKRLKNRLIDLLNIWNIKNSCYKDKNTYRIDMKSDGRLGFVNFIKDTKGLDRKDKQLEKVHYKLTHDMRTKEYRTRPLNSYYMVRKWKIIKQSQGEKI